MLSSPFWIPAPAVQLSVAEAQLCTLLLLSQDQGCSSYVVMLFLDTILASPLILRWRLPSTCRGNDGNWRGTSRRPATGVRMSWPARPPVTGSPGFLGLMDESWSHKVTEIILMGLINNRQNNYMESSPTAVSLGVGTERESYCFHLPVVGFWGAFGWFWCGKKLFINGLGCHLAKVTLLDWADPGLFSYQTGPTRGSQPWKKDQKQCWGGRINSIFLHLHRISKKIVNTRSEKISSRNVGIHQKMKQQHWYFFFLKLLRRPQFSVLIPVFPWCELSKLSIHTAMENIKKREEIFNEIPVKLLGMILFSHPVLMNVPGTLSGHS